jgi:hypothetical protein
MAFDPRGPWSRSAWLDLHSMRQHLLGFVKAYDRLPKYAKAQLRKELRGIEQYVGAADRYRSFLGFSTKNHFPEA